MAVAEEAVAAEEEAVEPVVVPMLVVVAPAADTNSPLTV